MAGGLVWAVAVIFAGLNGGGAFLPPPLAIPGALIGPGLVMIAMIGSLAHRRFFDDSHVDGQAFETGSPGWVDQQVLNNTVEQAVLAMLIWPFVALTLGGTVVIWMGTAFAAARVLFWIGYRRAPALRAFGFAATFYTTVLAGIWTLIVWL